MRQGRSWGTNQLIDMSKWHLAYLVEYCHHNVHARVKREHDSSLGLRARACLTAWLHAVTALVCQTLVCLADLSVQGNALQHEGSHADPKHSMYS